MDILPYLKTLLKTKKEVNLNGFGTFLKTRVPGRYDKGSDSYLPPFYTLNFKREAASDDLLANYISEDRHVSLNTASYYIDEYAASLNRILDENATVELPGIGRIVQQEDLLAFEADPAAELGYDFFGLPPVNALPATAEIPVKSAPVAAEDISDDLTAPEILQEKETQEKEAAVVTEYNDNQGNTEVFTAEAPAEEYLSESDGEAGTGQRKTGFIKWLIVIFILAAIAAVALMAKPELYEKLFGNKVPDTTLSDFDKNKLKPAPDTLTADTALTNKIKSAITDSIATVNKDSTTFEVFVAGVSTEAQAKKYIDRYNKMGFKAKAFPGKMIISISVASFNTEKAARDSLPAIKKRLKDNSIYIQQKKLK